MARRGQSGAALIAAMLIVAIVSAMAAAAAWHQAAAAGWERAQRSRIQAEWAFNGALEWAAARLREDGRGERVDHLGEAWARVDHADLRSFLGVAHGQAGGASEQEDGLLVIRIRDAQGRLNLFNLAEAGAIAPADLRVFQRLFAAAALPAPHLDRLVENLRQANGMESASLDQGRAALPPQRLAQLAWVGLPASTISVLQRHVDLLPARSPVNINTAGALVIHAASEGLSVPDAARIVERRSQTPFRTLAEAGEAVGRPDAFPPSRFSVSSRFFEITARLRTQETSVAETILVLRNGGGLAVLRRERGAPDNAQGDEPAGHWSPSR